MALLAAIPVLTLLVGVLGWLFDWHLGVDSAVYRAGATALLTGEPLYDSNALPAEPDWAQLPFTYPPAAALLFTPLALLPVQVAWGVLAAVSILALAVVIRVAIATLPNPAVGGPRWWVSPARATLVFSLAMLCLEPVWRTVSLGQINLVLLALVMLDVLVISAGGSRWGGVLVGIAAAVKLTPLIFVPHLFLTGRRAEARRALLTFVGLQGLMFVISPHDASRFWLHAVQDPDRIGPLHWAGNQSLTGLINRVSGLAPWSQQLAVGIMALLAVPALMLMLRFHARGQALAALLVPAFWALLFTPVSWSHHWVWAVPLVVLLVSRLPRTALSTAWRSWLSAGAVLTLFISCVLLILPNGRGLELHWTFWENVLGNSYILMPLILAAVLGIRWWRREKPVARRMHRQSP